jgi:hypothetical protein
VLGLLALLAEQFGESHTDLTTAVVVKRTPTPTRFW